MWARPSACLAASTGPRPMISGDRPVTPVDTIRARGVRPSSAAFVSDITTTAAAPSLSGQQLPAVTTPSGRNTGLSSRTASSVTPGRGPSSRVTSVPSGVVTGTISRAQKPLLMASSARFWLRTPNSSSSSRDSPRSRATFSAVWPIATYASGSSPFSLGSVQSRPPWASFSVRAPASANSGFWVSGRLSELPLTNRDTVSTPAEMKTSPSPALIAWKAIREVCTEDEQ